MTQLYYSTIEYLTKMLESHDIKSEKKQQIFTYLFFYSFLNHTTIKFRTSTKRYKYFISDATKVANANGLTISDLKGFSLVDDYSVYETIITASTYKNEINYFEMIPISLLYNVDSFESINDLVPETNDQKMFQNGKMKEFNERVDDVIHSLCRMEIVKRNLPDHFQMFQFGKQEKSGVLLVFRKIIKYFCPVNIIHEFSKGKCKHCGFLEPSLKNEKDSKIENEKGSEIEKNELEVFEKCPLENGVNEPRSIEHFKTPINDIDFSDLRESDLLEVLKGCRFYNDILSTIGKDPERDRKIIEDIFGYRIPKVSEKDIKFYFIYYAKIHSNDDLIAVLMYYYKIGIAESSYSLSLLALEKDSDEDAGDVEDVDFSA